LMMRELAKRGYLSLAIHGGKDQMDRDAAIADFKSGVVNILIGTSIAARGLDVKDLGLVINFDCPITWKTIFIGQAEQGEQAKKGTAMTLITQSQDKYAGDIIRALKASKVAIPADLTRLYKPI